MSWDPIQTSVFPEPLPPPGSGTTRATTFLEPEKAHVGAAGGMPTGRSVGVSPAKPHELNEALSKAFECSALIMRGDLELAIRDLQRCRSLSWISQEMRIQLGRCLYELTKARRMAP